MTTNSGKLFLVPVSLADTCWQGFLPPEVRARANELDYIIAENAKTARAQLRRMEVSRPPRDITIEVLPERPDAASLDRLVAPLTEGRDAGLMSEAGCPAVADPGALLVRRAHELGIRVVPLVGPSSLLLALMASGLDGQCFAFHGYLPVREEQRSRAIRNLEVESHQARRTQIFIETPYRNERMFAALLSTCQPKTLLCVACDLTAAAEVIATCSVAEWRSRPAPLLDRRPTVFLLLAR